MSLEQRWDVEAFANQIVTAKAEVELVYAGNGRWLASSTGAAGEISLTTPGGGSWPRLERLLRVLAAVGIFEAKVVFRGMPPVFAPCFRTTAANTGSEGGPAHCATVVDFRETARYPGAGVELELGSDGLWYSCTFGPDGRHALTPSFGKGWGRLEGLLQVLAGAGITEAYIAFKGMPPALVVVDIP